MSAVHSHCKQLKKPFNLRQLIQVSLFVSPKEHLHPLTENDVLLYNIMFIFNTPGGM